VAREKRLRVGLLSPDLYDHSCAYFLRTILANKDAARFEVACYSWSERSDWMTARLKGMADWWREVGGMGEAKLIETIRADGIDVLVELSGHTAMGPLAALRNRAAPVQATYLGYPNTTGLPTIDWRIVDVVTDPVGAEAWHTERLARLEGCFLCYSAPEHAPGVSVRSGAPTLQGQSRWHEGDHVTFGSFNSIRKINPSVIAAWAGVLRAVPRSRMLIKTRGLSGAYARGNIQELFAAEGIGAERVELHDMVASKPDHLGMYGRVDVGLDTFPYNGTATTCEALWMGVPVVTLEGRTHAGRVGMSLLRAAGLAELVARDAGEFVAIAAGLESRLMDGAAHAGCFYDAVRMMWRERCAAEGQGQ
jgi:protein O-GlcNAc transferase